MEQAQWEKVRNKGKLRFMIINGALIWGMTTAFFWSIVMHFIQPIEPFWVRPAIALMTFPIGGLFWGLWVWRTSEKKFQSNP